MKFVYVLTSSQEDNYLEQAYLSVYSLKKYNPNAEVVLLTDSDTNESFLLDKKRNSMSKIFTNIISVDIPFEFDQTAKSRWLKTSMPELVDGELVYIDCDTIITADLSEIQNIDCDVAGVLDNNCKISDSTFLQRLIRRKYTFSHRHEIFDHNVYINGGFLVYKNTPKAKEFFSMWHKLWLESWKRGVVLDQPALNETNFRMNWIIKEIDFCWNAQITLRLNSLENAKVIHYIVTNAENFYPLAQPEILEEIRNNGGITEEIKKMVDNPKNLFDTRKTLRIITDTNIALSETGMYAVLSKLYTKNKGLFKFFDKIFSFVLKFFGL